MREHEEQKQEIFRKIRAVVAEYGDIFRKDKSVCVISDVDYGYYLGGITHVYAPTGTLTLGNVDFKVARFFEDI